MLKLIGIVGDSLLAMLGFVAEFLGSCCLILLQMVVFIILFVFLIGLGWVIGTVLLEMAREKDAKIVGRKWEDE